MKTKIFDIEKRAVPPRTNAHTKMIDALDYNANRYNFQYNCTFCCQNLEPDSIRFKGIGTCPRCFQNIDLFMSRLREYCRDHRSQINLEVTR